MARLLREAATDLLHSRPEDMVLRLRLPVDMGQRLRQADMVQVQRRLLVAMVHLRLGERLRLADTANRAKAY